MNFHFLEIVHFPLPRRAYSLFRPFQIARQVIKQPMTKRSNVLLCRPFQSNNAIKLLLELLEIGKNVVCKVAQMINTTLENLVFQKRNSESASERLKGEEKGEEEEGKENTNAHRHTHSTRLIIFLAGGFASDSHSDAFPSLTTFHSWLLCLPRCLGIMVLVTLAMVSVNFIATVTLSLLFWFISSVPSPRTSWSTSQQP